MGLSICMSVCLLLCLWKKCENLIFLEKLSYSELVSIDDLQEIVHGLFKEPSIGTLKSKMPEITCSNAVCQH